MVRLVAGPEVLVAERLKAFRSPEATLSRHTLLAVTSTPVTGGWNWPVVALDSSSLRSPSCSGAPSRSTVLVAVAPSGNATSGKLTTSTPGLRQPPRPLPEVNAPTS